MRTIPKILALHASAVALAVCAAATPAAAQAQQAAAITATPRHAAQVSHAPSLLADLLGRVQANGETKTGNHLNLPYGIALDQGGNLYVASVLGNNVAVYNSKHQFTGQITAGMAYPAGVAITDEGNIAVINNIGSTINFYAPNGTQNGSINDPALANGLDVAVDTDDTVWALDASGYLHAYLADGTILPPTQTGGASAIGLWGPNITAWGVLDQDGGYDEFIGNRASSVRYNPSLNAEFSQVTPSAGGQTTDSTGLLYITDIVHNTVDIWAASGVYESPVTSFPVPAEPIGVAVDSVHNQIYVAFPTLNEVIVYSRNAPYKQLKVLN